MASVQGRILSDNVNVTAVGVLTECPTETLSKDNNFVGSIVVTNAAAANFVISIEHSADGVNWEDLIVFTATIADGFENVFIDNSTQHVLRFIRASVKTHTAGAADVLVTLLNDRD